MGWSRRCSRRRMKKFAGKVTKIDDFFGRKSKSSKGKAIEKKKSRYKKHIDRTPTRHKI
jgi:hypothetical protein